RLNLITKSESLKQQTTETRWAQRKDRIMAGQNHAEKIICFMILSPMILPFSASLALPSVRHRVSALKDRARMTTKMKNETNKHACRMLDEPERYAAILTPLRRRNGNGRKMDGRNIFEE